MTISLIRHGRPLADYRTRISCTAFDAWLTSYDGADVDPSLPPLPELRDAIVTCDLVVTSRHRRAVRSAELLNLPARRVVMEEAREAPLPGQFFCPVAMTPLSFTVLARILWNLGLARCAETRREAMVRARHFASSLAVLADEVGHVAVVGHGYFHRFTGAALLSSGWHRTQAGRGYWSLSQFQKPNQPPRQRA